MVIFENFVKGSITSKQAHAQCVQFFQKLNVVNQSF